MAEKLQITVDGRSREVARGAMLLDALRGLGVHVPTLCHHPSLEPSGACRLCVVEITHADWKGWSGLVTSCLYPVEPGLEVSTRSERVRAARRTLLELYLAEHSDVERVRALARGEGVEVTPFREREEIDRCVLCGLCTRVCQDLGPAAISPLGRGTDKAVGPRPDDVGEDCTGCRACAEICPTNAIPMEQANGKLRIWNRDFPIPVCEVAQERCNGCGLCEEVCPEAIPRVIAHLAGDFTAYISPSACTGCGLCAGVCPVGAIAQQGYPDDLCDRLVKPGEGLRGRTVVFTCSRSPFPEDTDGLISVPCVGRVPLDTLLSCLALGADGALVVCRDTATCPFGRGGEQARRRVDVAKELAASAGLGEERIRFVRPAPGLQGPAEALSAFRESLRSSTLEAIWPFSESGAIGLDRARDILRWLRASAGLEPALPRSVASLLDSLEGPGAWQEAPLRRAGALHDGTGARRPDGATTERRISSHPIRAPLAEPSVDFTFNDEPLLARPGEVISSALYAAGIPIFGHHPRDGAPQGIFCVNGQCSQCTVMADGRAVKSCMTRVKPGMKVRSCEGLPGLVPVEREESAYGVEDFAVQVLVVGGGPAGISAAVELGRLGIDVLVVDDKQELGGKLSLQTHGFFGSVADCFAGTRGVDIGRLLAEEAARLPSVKVWLGATVVGVFHDGKLGVACEGEYRLVTPERVLIACGAREKSLAFPGCDLPGVYGAGAFQTLANRDLVRSARRLFVVGGGNVGLIGAYHALQAGIDVAGLVEALPRCGGYKVHEDKIARLGVPIWTSHSVVRVEGTEKVERVVIAAVDERFRPVPGTERSFEVDTVLIAVGLAPVGELLRKAREYGMKVYAAGDSEEIAEASAAIFSGKITGRTMARDLGIDVPIPSDWQKLGEVLKHKPEGAEPFVPEDRKAAVYPLLRCVQEIPCDPCIEACPHGLITMKGSILSLPEFEGDCVGCGRCVLACPGLAIQLVMNDYDPAGEKALLMVPFEFAEHATPLGEEVTTTDMEGNAVGVGRVIAVRDREDQDRRRLLLLEVPARDKLSVAGFRIREPEEGLPAPAEAEDAADPVICRCERVRRSEIAAAIRAGTRDMNQLKAVVRSGMGGCGGKTCTELVLRLFREEGVDLSEVTLPTVRPLIAEVHLGDFVRTDGREQE